MVVQFPVSTSTNIVSMLVSIAQSGIKPLPYCILTTASEIPA
jgi:hypothetical protein